MTRPTKAIQVFGVAALLAAGVDLARAQDIALPETTPPSKGDKGAKGDAAEPDLTLDVDRQIDLANVVTSAAKGVTTVQEAPAIITIITADDIKARGYKFIDEPLQTIPGWGWTSYLGHQLGLPLVRGTGQAALLLQDGVSMFDPFGNLSATNRTLPLETIKRIEVVTGPGGVLWGANSFLGIINVIMKDAEDINGVEFSAGYGDGPGNKQHFKAYGMFGKSFLRGKLKIFQHLSYENWIGDVFNTPQFVASSPAPQPVGPAFFGPLHSEWAKGQSLDPARSWMVNITGKYTFGPITLSYRIPVGNMWQSLIFANNQVPGELFNIYDRYAFAEYKDRFWKDRFGLTVKGYYTQFVRNFIVQLFSSSALFPGYDVNGRWNYGGLNFDIQTMLTQRAGGTVDMDLNLKYGFRLLFGGEVFWESLSNSTQVFPSHELALDPGVNPVNTAAALPLVCPQEIGPNGQYRPVARCPRQFLNDASRIVGALYANIQYRPVQKLTLDAGIRIQKGFGGRPYDLVPLYTAAVVWNFAPDWHFKANYTTGFRPTVFNNTDPVRGGINYGGNPDLKPETSQSFQGEINARLLRNVRKVRELELRLDYSYTFLDKLLVISGGTYKNAGQRAIHSVEAYGKLYLAGDHFLQASYTFLHVSTSDAGILRAVPNHWVSLGGSFNLVKNLLDVNVNLLVTGAYEDPNRIPSSNSSLPAERAGAPVPTTSARTTDLTWDRLTPVANLQLGFRLRFLKDRLGISGQFYNVLNQRYYYTDAFSDTTPSIEMTPNPAPGFNFFGSITYRN
jgi:outer membrane receptor protein involved in Fe transport